MRGIIWRFKRFESEDIEKSTWPKGISEYREFEKNVKEFHDVIGIFLCVEKDDKKEYLKSLVNRIIELNDQFYKLKKIVVIPFAHLSNKLEKPEKVMKMLEKLVELLKENGFKTFRVSFGTHKRALWEIPGNVAEASYFEYPYIGEKPEV